MKGRVAVLQKYGGDFDLREYPVPDPEPGAVLVRLTHAGICGSDLHIWRGEMKGLYGEVPKDLTFGHEMCGRVERLGAGVTTDSLGAPLREGDRVTYCYFFPAGAAPSASRTRWAPARGRAGPIAWRARRPTSTMPTGTTTISVPATSSSGLPEEIPDAMATPANCALAQVIYGFSAPASASATPWWCRGPAGSASTRWRWPATWGRTRCWRWTASRAPGAGAGLRRGPHALLRELDTPERRIQAVMDLTGGFGADLVADFVGYPQVVPEGLRMLRGGGTLSGSRQHLAGQCLLLRRHRAGARRGAAGRRVQLLAVGAG